jgi:outer membrane protein assembly factor BamC
MTLCAKRCGKLTLLCNTMKNKFWLFSISIATTVLAGCSYLQSYFPDKERDYQYTTEIPMINWPAELRKSQSTGGVPEISSLAANPDASADTSAGAAAAPADNAKAAAETSSSTTSTPDEKDTVSSVELLKYDDGESRLRLDAGFSKSWRVVSKALSHNSIEVTERDLNQGLFTVQYDPEEKKVKDESFMDELSFFFHGIDSKEQEYFLKLEEHDQQTDVIVQNNEHLPLPNNDAASRLLKVLADTINADLVKKANKANKANKADKK